MTVPPWGREATAMSKTLIHGDTTYHFKTNGHPRQLVAWHDLPPEAKDEMQYLLAGALEDLYTLRFFEYRGSWYDAYEFEPTRAEGAEGVVRGLGFEAWQTESAFSAVLIKSYEYDEVIVGYLHW